jgi:hypothetical protein
MANDECTNEVGQKSAEGSNHRTSELVRQYGQLIENIYQLIERRRRLIQQHLGLTAKLEETLSKRAKLNPKAS